MYCEDFIENKAKLNPNVRRAWDRKCACYDYYHKDIGLSCNTADDTSMSECRCAFWPHIAMARMRSMHGQQEWGPPQCKYHDLMKHNDPAALKVTYHPLYSMNKFVTNKSKLLQDGARVFPYMG